MLNDDFPNIRAGRRSRRRASSCISGPDADAAWQRAIDAGAEVRFELADQFWGDRYGQVKDPFGFIWSIGAPVKQAQQQSAEQPATA